MKKLLLVWLVITLIQLPGLAQRNSAWSQDSLRYRGYVNQANKLGTAKRDSALVWAEKALQLAQLRKQKHLEADSYNQVGTLSVAYATRVDYYYKALRIYDELNNQVGLGDTYMKLAEAVRLQSNNKYPKEVLEYAQKAAGAYQRVEHRTGLMQAVNMTGIYYAMTGQPEVAIRHFEDVKNRMIALKMDSSRIMAVENNLANLQSSSNPEEALRRLLVVYAFNKRKDGFAGFGLISGLAYSYRARKQPKELIYFAKEGLEKAIELQNLGRQVSFHQYLHDGYKELRDFEQALFHAGKVRILSDSLSKQEDAGRIADAQQKYQNEKKQAEIEKQRRELLENELAIEQVKNQKIVLGQEKALLDRELALKTQRFATEAAEQKLKEARFTNQSQQQKATVQQLRVENLKQQNEKHLLRESGRAAQTRIWLGVALFFILTLIGGLLWRNRLLSQKNAELQAASLQGQTLERKRVAADLHDNLGTTLSALRWNLEAMDTAKLTAVEQAVYATINQQVNQAYNDVRLLSHNLLPDELAKQGLAVALRNLVDKMNRNTPVRFHLTGTNDLPRLDRQTEFELYSICLELLNNTIKHAHATEGCIDFAQANATLHLSVGDNGMGLNGQRSDGRGLQNVAARVESLAGTWLVDSTPAGGVQNRITVPVRTPARASSQT